MPPFSVGVVLVPENMAPCLGGCESSSGPFRERTISNLRVGRFTALFVVAPHREHAHDPLRFEDFVDKAMLKIDSPGVTAV